MFIDLLVRLVVHRFLHVCLGDGGVQECWDQPSLAFSDSSLFGVKVLNTEVLPRSQSAGPESPRGCSSAVINSVMLCTKNSNPTLLSPPLLTPPSLSLCLVLCTFLILLFHSLLSSCFSFSAAAAALQQGYLSLRPEPWVLFFWPTIKTTNYAS